jgi:ABC-type Fe3+/spermidine/putrescine transport system ATPase subunit
MASVELKGLTKRFGAEVAVQEVDLTIAQGEFVTLLGPSGCGKTTTLRCIAGLEHPDAGEIRIGGKVVASHRQGLFLPPEARNIGMVFQSYAVWPHMTVFDNVAYGLRVRGADRATLRRATEQALELVGLAPLAHRYATRLSGGQRQRVALARAIAYRPRVILFDEPLSNLDAKLREQLRDELARLPREVGITAIYVTHDQTEALVMSDRIVVMDRGRIQQIGDPFALYVRPANGFVASFIGVANLLPARLLSSGQPLWELELARGDGLAPVRVRTLPAPSRPAGDQVLLSIRPEDLQLHTRREDANGDNLIEAAVTETVYLGNLMQCKVRAGRHELSVQLDHDEALAPQQRVYLSFAPDHAVCLQA